MKAVVFDAFGGSERLRMAEVRRSAPAVIDYAREKFVDAMRTLVPVGVDIVCDSVGGHVRGKIVLKIG